MISMKGIRGMRRLMKRGESGSALVETALTMPVLLILLLGAFQFADMAYKAMQVTSAARAAAQYAAMNGGNYMDTRATGGIVAAANADAPRVKSSCSSFTVSSSPACVCSDTTACSGAAGSWTCTTGKPVVTVTVQTTATCSPAAMVPGFSGAFTLHGYAQQEVLQ